VVLREGAAAGLGHSGGGEILEGAGPEIWVGRDGTRERKLGTGRCGRKVHPGGVTNLTVDIHWKEILLQPINPPGSRGSLDYTHSFALAPSSSVILFAC
jgi:hypothetical protein